MLVEKIDEESGKVTALSRLNSVSVIYDMKLQKPIFLKPLKLITWLLLMIGLGWWFAWTAPVAQAQGPTEPIVDLKIIKDTTECNDSATGDTGWERIDTDLNLGLDDTTDPAFYLCVKRAGQNTPKEDYITDFYPVNITYLFFGLIETGTRDCEAGDFEVKDKAGTHVNINEGPDRENEDYLCYSKAGTDQEDQEDPLLDVVFQTTNSLNGWTLQKPTFPAFHLNVPKLTFKLTPGLFLFTLNRKELDSGDFYCGGEGEDPCDISTHFWWENGNTNCDRGLQGSLGTCENTTRYSAFIGSNAANNFLGSWEEWALNNQRNELAMHEPINWVMLVGTHNSYNNTNDGYIAPNDLYSMTDQLRGGVRRLNPDVKLSLTGRLKLCHAKESTRDIACSDTDRMYFPAIKEIDHWLRQPENSEEIIIINFEADDNIPADLINNPIERYLGELVYKPSDCETVLPKATADCSTFEPGTNDPPRWPTREELLRAKKQVIFLSGYPEDWKYIWVDDNEVSWPDSKAINFFNTTKPKNIDDCSNWIADPHKWGGWIEEDRSVWAQSWYAGLIDEERMAELAKCNASTSLDYVHVANLTGTTVCDNGKIKEGLTDPCPNPDKRLAKAVWSWREGDKGQNGNRALFHKSDGRWSSRDKSEQHHFACAFSRSGDPLNWWDPRGVTWEVTKAVGTWAEGKDVCQNEYPFYTFAAPVNGWQNERLKEALSVAAANSNFDTTSEDVWLNYQKFTPQGSKPVWTTGDLPAPVTNSPTREGSTTHFAASLLVDIDNEAFTYEWRFADNSRLLGSGESLAYIFQDSGTFDIMLQVKFKGEDANPLPVQQFSFPLTVNNMPPAASLPAGAVVDEGSKLTLNFTNPTDPSPADTAAGFHYAYDCHDGALEGATYANSSAGAAIECTYDDGPGQQTIRARIIDQDDGHTEYITLVTVNNISPTANFAGDTVSVDEGLPATLFSEPFDPSSADMTAGLHYAYAGAPIGFMPAPANTIIFGCDDSSLLERPYHSGSPLGETACRFTDGPSAGHPVRARIIDQDEGYTEYVGLVTVNNVAPNVASPTVDPATSAEGSPVTAKATFTDPGLLDAPFSCTVDYGDGSAVLTGTVVDDSAEFPGQVISGTCTGPAHVYADDGPYQVTIAVTDKDDDSGTNTTSYPVANVAPTVVAGADQTVKEGDLVNLAPATFNDKGTLDTHTATIDWGDTTAIETGSVTETPFGPPGDTAGANGSVAGSHVYADNGSYIVTVCVKDDEGAETCDSLTVTVNNVAPTVAAGANQTANEGDLVNLAPATFNDKGTLDTHEATIDWGEGTVDAGLVTETPFGPPGDTAGMDGSVAGSHTYGDNGTYTVTICLTDDDDGVGCDTLTVTVNNLNPTAAIDTEAAITFAAGPAFLGRRDVAQTFSAQADDPGSDDLTFTWGFPPSANEASTIYYNDGANPDLLPSPHGIYPFTATDDSSTTFSAPGVYSVDLSLADDDEGTAANSLPLLVTDSRECTKSQGFWQQQLNRQDRQEIDDTRLLGYLALIRFASAYFDDINLATLADAEAILKPDGGNDPARQARRQTLAAWLNFAAGGVRWPEVVPRLEQPFAQAMANIEVTLDANASQQAYNAAMQDAQAINSMHPSQASCEPT